MSEAADPWGHERLRRFRPPVRTFDDADAVSPLRIAFLVGSTDISGGTYVILQHALHAHQRGHDVTIIPFFPPSSASLSWHPAYEELRVVQADELDEEPFDLAVATWWRTVYELWKVPAASYMYFVQSLESRFYDDADGLAVALADRTYELDLPTVTIATWLQWYLALEYGRPALVVQNGIDKRIYRHIGPAFADREPARLRVLIEGPVDVPMKNVPNTIELARKSGVDEIWLLTSSDVDSVEGVDRIFSRIPVAATAGVYRSCDVLLKLSYVEGMFGPPLEIFHCGGTAVTWDVTGHEEYIRHGENGVVIGLGNEGAVVDALRQLREDRRELARLKRGALETAASWPSWPETSSRFVDACEVVARQPPRDHGELLAASRLGHAELE